MRLAGQDVKGSQDTRWRQRPLPGRQPAGRRQSCRGLARATPRRAAVDPMNDGQLTMDDVKARNPGLVVNFPLSIVNSLFSYLRSSAFIGGSFLRGIILVLRLFAGLLPPPTPPNQTRGPLPPPPPPASRPFSPPPLRPGTTAEFV